MGFWKKRSVFRKKTFKIWKNADGSKFDVECHRNSKFFKTLKHWAIQNKRRFFLQKTWIFWKQLKLANWMSNANGTVRFLKTFKSWVFLQKKMRFPRKNLEVFKNCWCWQVCCRMQLDSSYFSKISKNLSCSEKKVGFSKKINSSKMARGSNFAV